MSVGHTRAHPKEQWLTWGAFLGLPGGGARGASEQPAPSVPFGLRRSEEVTGSEGLGCPPGTVAPRALGRGGTAPLSGLGCGLGHPCSCPKRHPPGRRPCQEASEKAQRTSEKTWGIQDMKPKHHFFIPTLSNICSFLFRLNRGKRRVAAVALGGGLLFISASGTPLPGGPHGRALPLTLFPQETG